MATIGKIFKFSVFSQRWEREEIYTLRIMHYGWRISFGAIEGDCEPDGSPLLEKNLRHDRIRFPAQLGDGIEKLYGQRRALNDQEFQAELQRLADWVSMTEKHSPKDGAFEGFW